MQMLASFLRSPVSSGGIIVIIIRLPYERRIGRMAHPNQNSGGIVPHFIVPCFVHAFHYFNIQQLCFLAEFFQIGRFSELCIHWFFIIDRIGIGSLFSEEVLIPDIIIVVLQLIIGRKRPPRFFRDELLHTLKSRESGGTNLRTHAITMIYPVWIGRFTECQVTARSLKVMFRRLISPPTATGESIFIGTWFIHPVVIVFFGDHFAQVIVQFWFGMRFVCTTPEGDRRMVSQTSHLIERICFERFWLSHIIIGYI